MKAPRTKTAVWLAAFLTIWLAGEVAAAPAACTAPAPVCAARASVFAIVSDFDPAASAVLIAPGLLVTNRHVTVDGATVRILVAGAKHPVVGRVVPNAYRGDLILVRAKGLKGRPLARAPSGEPPFYTVAASPKKGDRAVRVYKPGSLIARPARGRPLSRLHHRAAARPGNSGGALVDEEGRLVGIVTAGGEGYNNAIPVADLVILKVLSGPAHAAASARLGAAYRTCVESSDRLGRAPSAAAIDAARDACMATGNAQFAISVGQMLGKARRYGESAKVLRRALDQDPDNPGALLSLAVTLHFAKRWREELRVIYRLIGLIPEQFRVMRLGLQAAKAAGDEKMMAFVLEAIDKHHPDAGEKAREFLKR